MHLNPNQTVQLALTALFGIGHQKAIQICAQCGISDQFLVSQLTRYQLDQLSQFLSLHYTFDSELRRTIKHDIQRTISIGSYRGFRHHAGLPVRGQRTHTNAKTCRRARHH